ncbi:MAG TPA: exonuclease domain-containing protein, partial [Pseudomonadales bacterium]|nr:exonuclease domain-containing protein [Pseudomonadales bacterium]
MAIIHGFESRHSLCDDQGVMTDSLYWYDFETTGTDPARDRAIQFAGVRTDLKLNTVSEPVNVFCYPGNDTVPDPEAILVTGI